jgi:protein phosphatase 1 regulatory subunit 7
LTELYLSENGIEIIENLDANTKLETLDVAKNRIKCIENVSHLEVMDEFWVSYTFFNLFRLKLI